MFRFSFRIAAAPAVFFLAAALSGNVNASTVGAFTDCNTDGSSHNPGVSTTPNVAATSIISGCNSTATADYGLLRVGGNSGATTGSANASANYEIDFFLSNPSLGQNAHITLNVPIPYHFILSASSTQSTASFNLSNIPGFYLVQDIATSANGGQFCANPSPNPPFCNGTYEGTVNLAFDAVVNSTGPNRFALAAAILAGNGSADATNTITLGNVILPDGVTFSYDIAGNPMNFGYAGASVPEPSTMSFALAGVACLFVLRGRKRV